MSDPACERCRWWSADDDPGDDGCCARRLNDPGERLWRTMPDFACDLFVDGLIGLPARKDYR